ncbi:unnamed protein product [Notodromas monacha]|uniref:EF-hand domain-containing protein n=1 Tax=Notodromas monacha TaxID=399045 RepID=A0A7R9BN87_9CRUS|nr:unnamed protein product [Notodromas monacha]CAG0918629.1 unnamed protein product [Notodromas monacha]
MKSVSGNPEALIRELLPDFGADDSYESDSRLTSLYRDLMNDTCMYAFQVPTDLPHGSLFAPPTSGSGDVHSNGNEDDGEEAMRCTELYKIADGIFVKATRLDKSGKMSEAMLKYKECLKVLEESVKYRCDKQDAASLRWREVIHSQRASRHMRFQVLSRLREIQLLQITDFMVWEKTSEFPTSKSEKLISLKCGAYVFRIGNISTKEKKATATTSVNYQAMPVCLYRFQVETSGSISARGALKIGADWFPILNKRTPILLAPAVPCIILHNTTTSNPGCNFIGLLFPSNSSMMEINYLEYMIIYVLHDNYTVAALKKSTSLITEMWKAPTLNTCSGGESEVLCRSCRKQKENDFRAGTLFCHSSNSSAHRRRKLSGKSLLQPSSSLCIDQLANKSKSSSKSLKRRRWPITRRETETVKKAAENMNQPNSEVLGCFRRVNKVLKKLFIRPRWDPYTSCDQFNVSRIDVKSVKCHGDVLDTPKNFRATGKNHQAPLAVLVFLIFTNACLAWSLRAHCLGMSLNSSRQIFRKLRLDRVCTTYSKSGWAVIFVAGGVAAASCYYAKQKATPLFGWASVHAHTAMYLEQSVQERIESERRRLRSQQRIDDFSSNVKLTSRERRFIKFASVEHGGQLFMTPQDFLESVTEAEPRPRVKRRILTKKDLDGFYDYTPTLKKGGTRLFRTIHDKGILSYTEYLFLLSILTKPQSGFSIAFNMFDTDGNHRVDKDEFLVNLMDDPIPREILNALLARSVERHAETDAERALLEKIFSQSRLARVQEDLEYEERTGKKRITRDTGEMLQREEVADTTLLIHFFGRKGQGDLKFEEFKRFMENLQTEVLELEFNEFARGLHKINEVDFAKILLRYTYLRVEQYSVILERLLDRLTEEVGIDFEEFKAFCQFLNNLEDFGIAMRMYTLADRPISQDEFHRAVKICTGQTLSKHVVNTVFLMFDEDGDGQLSYKEFIAIMKDRIHRGFKFSMVMYVHSSRNEGWDAFKACLKQEMKSPI